MPRRVAPLFPGERIQLARTVITPDWANDIQREIAGVTESALARRPTRRRGFVGRVCTGFSRWLRRS